MWELITDFLGVASDSRRFLNLSPLPALSVMAVPVVDNWRRIHGKLPKAMSTSDSRRPPTRCVCRELDPTPPPVGHIQSLLFPFLPPASLPASLPSPLISTSFQCLIQIELNGFYQPNPIGNESRKSFLHSSAPR